MSELIAAAFYKFVELADYVAMKPALLARCESLDIKGTILLAREGINGTIAGHAKNVRAILDHLRGDERLKDLQYKESPASPLTFYRMKVRLKKEIVTLGVPGVSPVESAGTYVKPADWNKLLDDPDVVVIDVRNDYEVAIGTFKGAVNPNTKRFSDLPAWVATQAQLRSKPKVAMFCTGGIRCEKSTALLRSQGFPEVFHLEGGILKYLETIPKEQNRFEGECFVFDERVSVGIGLERGTFELCRSCREPVGDAERASPLFERGVSCPKCHRLRNETKKAGLRERQRQVEIARTRNRLHVGARHPPKKPKSESE